MALAPDATFGLAMATAIGVAGSPAAVLAYTALATAINTQVKLADLKPAAVRVPISGPPGSTPAVGTAVLI